MDRLKKKTIWSRKEKYTYNMVFRILRIFEIFVIREIAMQRSSLGTKFSNLYPKTFAVIQIFGKLLQTK